MAVKCDSEAVRQRETVADILADVRERAENAMRNGERLVHNEVVANMLTFVADRIEAAWKRDEERAVEHATRHAEAVARDNCRDCVHNPNGKNYKGGNEAAMREACQKMLDLLMLRGDGKVRCVLTWDEFNESQKMLRIALSRPPRNCNRFADAEAARQAWLDDAETGTSSGVRTSNCTNGSSPRRRSGKEMAMKASEEDDFYCPLCGCNLLWMPVSHIFVCEHCKESFSESAKCYLRKKKDVTKGNTAAMREALEKARGVIKAMGGYWARETLPIIDAALSKPPRQCDMGTVEEQKDRFMEFCDDEKGGRQHCRNCRLCNACDCELAWAQMPYTAERKGEGDGSK